MNITEDYISFEVAKLLKEKGFNEEIETLISPDGKIYHCDERSVFKIPHKTIKNSDINIYIDDCSCPTLQMTMKWLRDVHKLNIGVVLNQDVQDEEAEIENYYFFNVSRLDGFLNEGGNCKLYKSYEEACEVAIKYCLTNLI